MDSTYVTYLIFTSHDADASIFGPIGFDFQHTLSKLHYNIYLSCSPNMCRAEGREKQQKKQGLCGTQEAAKNC